MKRLSTLLSFNLVLFLLAVLPTGFAGPASTHFNRNVDKCGSKRGSAVAAPLPGALHYSSTTSNSTPSVAPASTSNTTRPAHKAAVPASSSPKSTSKQLDSSTTSSADIDAYLLGHNSIRAQHGAVDLTWSDDAASKAQEWANNCKFVHSQGALGPFGENLAAGTGDFTISAAIKAWTDEAPQYDPSNPEPSHFTQVVWKATTEVGCAVATCSGIFDASFGPAQFYVCEYFPEGNVDGEYGQNVQV